MSEHLIVHDEDGMRVITMRRPEKKNALTQDMYVAMSDAIDTAQNNPDIRCLIITGVSGVFTAGNDLDDFLKDEPKDLLTVLRATGDWLDRSLQREHALVQRNIDALAGLLQLNPAERAILLYGTLARYQRELRGALVEFKVNTAQEAFAAIAAVAGVDEREVAEALRAGSRAGLMAKGRSRKKNAAPPPSSFAES